MTQGLAKYHARSPRYILNTEDDFLIRVAGPQQTPWEEGTEIKNVSLSGLAFTAPEDLCPVLGEVIKIQFSVPGSKQMACYAIVTRLDAVSELRYLVGVHFYKLEMPQRIILAQGLSSKFKTYGIKDKNEIDTDLQEWFSNLPYTLLMALFLCLWSWLMVAMSSLGYQGLGQILFSWL